MNIALQPQWLDQKQKQSIQLTFKFISSFITFLIILQILQLGFMESSNKTNEDPRDLSDLEEQRRILLALINDMEHQKKQPQTEIIYNPKLQISQIFKVATYHEPKIDRKASEDKSVLGGIKKFLTQCTSACTSEKNKQKILQIGVIIFSALKKDEIDWLQRHYKKYQSKDIAKLHKQRIIEMLKILSQTRLDIERDRVDQSTKQSVIYCIKELENLYEYNKPKHQHLSKFKSSFHSDKSELFTMMISAYHAFDKNYTPYKRTKLKKVFKNLQSKTKNFTNSIEVLRFLENKSSLLVNLQPINQLHLNAETENLIKTYRLQEGIHQTQITKISLVKVSESFKRRRVVNLLISGFLSEDKDKKEQWNQLLACMPDSEVYGLNWQSDTINRLVKFLALSIKDLVIGKDFKDLLTKDNPFIPAFQISIKAGKQLAYIVNKLFPFQFINVVSYSLGSQLIRAFLEKSIQLNGGTRINKVIMMGGVSDVKEIQETLNKTNHSINIMNVKTKHDSVLKYILKRAKPKITPIGLNNIPQQTGNHLIENLDVSDKIKGHFSFMTNFGTIAEFVKLSEE